jgi:hypothetical protein
MPTPVTRVSVPPEHDGGRGLAKAAAGLAAAAVLSLTGDVVHPPPARAESLTVAFPVSKAREVGLHVHTNPTPLLPSSKIVRMIFR